MNLYRITKTERGREELDPSHPLDEAHVWAKSEHNARSRVAMEADDQSILDADLYQCVKIHLDDDTTTIIACRWRNYSAER